MLSLGLHSCITKVQLITIVSFSYVNIQIGPILLDIVFPFKWLRNEFEFNMFHDLQQYLNNFDIKYFFGHFIKFYQNYLLLVPKF